MFTAHALPGMVHPADVAAARELIDPTIAIAEVRRDGNGFVHAVSEKLAPAIEAHMREKGLDDLATLVIRDGQVSVGIQLSFATEDSYVHHAWLAGGGEFPQRTAYVMNRGAP